MRGGERGIAGRTSACVADSQTAHWLFHPPPPHPACPHPDPTGCFIPLPHTRPVLTLIPLSLICSGVTNVRCATGPGILPASVICAQQASHQMGAGRHAQKRQGPRGGRRD